jgi:hypothetical protein
MPKVKSYAASWLSKNAPGHRLFEPSSESLRSRTLSPSDASNKRQTIGPRRTLAIRGTEVFVASGKDIRWGDLAYLKEEWAAKQSRGRHGTPGARFKAEDSFQSIEDGAEPENGAGLRVRLILARTSIHYELAKWSADIHQPNRLSRLAVPKIFDSCRSRQIRITSPFSRRTLCIYVCFRTRHTLRAMTLVR